MRADLFTGKYTFPYLGWAPLPADETPLAEILQKTGYTTLAAVDTPFFVRNGYGYDRGFKDFSWILGQGDRRERSRVDGERRYEEDYMAPKTIIAAERYLEYYYKEKFFLYVDMWDPHEPWDPPPWYVEPYYPGYDGRVVSPVYWDYREKGVSEEELGIAHACYCGEITMVDRWVGRLMEKVRAMGLWEDTAILFTSDHGYYFGEHGQFGKGRGLGSHWAQSALYREVTRVPLIIRLPATQSRVAGGPVSSVDIAPTVLDLAGIAIPPSVHGLSLAPALRGEGPSPRDFAVSSFPLYNPGEPSRIVDDWLRTVDEPHFSTVSTDRWTFLYSTENHPAQLYDIKTDPGEARNVIEDHRETARRLHSLFVGVLEKAGTEERYLAIRRKLHGS
jgi:arylsulfatase A-like enzyme